MHAHVLWDARYLCLYMNFLYKNCFIDYFEAALQLLLIKITFHVHVHTHTSKLVDILLCCNVCHDGM